MLDLVLKFAGVCREADLRVSTAELIDCAKQLELVDILDEAQFKAVLRANFAKSRREQKSFDQLYQLFFHDMAPPGVEAMDSAETFLDRLGRKSDESPIDPPLLDFLKGEPGSYLRYLRALDNHAERSGQLGMKSNLGQLSGRLSVMLRINRIRSEIQLFARSLPEGVPEDGGRRMAAHLESRLEMARQLLTQDSRPYNEALKQVRSHDLHYPDLGEKPFGALSIREIEEMRDSLEKLVRKLKDAATRRFAARNRGLLDVKKTLRTSGRFQGVPLSLKFKNRPFRKAKIVVLCDVSGSVWSAARFMLNLVYAMQDCFSRVHSFAFVREPTDITETLENNEINQAVEKVLASEEIGFHAQTDYGEMLYRFHRGHRHLLDRRTTLIIMGDARSNYHHPREGLLEELRGSCRRIVWLNPEPEIFWGTGDSEMPAYKAYCHELRPCRNLNQLIDFIEDLVL